ncbi:hypothetical protein ACSBR1_039813 [Camellia fascicularis]
MILSILLFRTPLAWSKFSRQRYIRGYFRATEIEPVGVFRIISFRVSSIVELVISLIFGIPNSLVNSRTITSLVLRNNSLNGVIDLNCSEMTHLISLSLAESFRNFHGLSRLSLSNSTIFNLSVALDILQHCQNLTILALPFSFLGEQLPCCPSLGFKNLKAFFIGNCILIGVFPQWLRGLTNLQLLDLLWNRLDGAIPPWLGNFELLFYIDLSNNSFTREIPKNLTGLKCLISRDVSQEDPSLGFAFPLFLILEH